MKKELVLMEEENKMCFYCLKKNVKLAKLEDWTGRGILRYYCKEHYYEVKKFQEKQKKDFIDYFSRIPIIENEDVKKLLEKFKN